MYTRVVVPLDGSPFAEQALLQAVDLARLTGADVHLVRVADARSLAQRGAGSAAAEASAVGPLLTEAATDAESYLQRARLRLREDGLDATAEVVHGPVARAIVARTRAGDVLVMASHGRSGVARWFLGSVAEDVLRRANVPVLLIRADPEGTGGQGGKGTRGQGDKGIGG